MRIALEAVVSADDPDLLRRWITVISATPHLVQSVLGGIQLKMQPLMAAFLAERLRTEPDSFEPIVLAAAVGGVIQAAQTRWFLQGGDIVALINEGLEVLERGSARSHRRRPDGEARREANAPFEPARTAFDWLSRDEDEVDRYVADPLCGEGNPLTYGYLIDLFEVLAPAGELLHTIRGSVLVIAGDQDPAAAMGAHATTLAESPPGRGCPRRPAHLRGRPPRAPQRDQPRRGHPPTSSAGWLHIALTSG